MGIPIQQAVSLTSSIRAPRAANDASPSLNGSSISSHGTLFVLLYFNVSGRPCEFGTPAFSHCNRVCFINIFGDEAAPGTTIYERRSEEHTSELQSRGH